MMNEDLGRTGTVLLAAAVAVTLVGCQTLAPDVSESTLAVDPCADRLHDISGHLLTYYGLHKRLPETIDDLPTEADQSEAPPMVCPVSGEPYIYDPEGLEIPGQPGRLVLYDAAAAHSGMRWGIVIIEPKGRGPLTCQVVRLPESFSDSARTLQDSTFHSVRAYR